MAFYNTNIFTQVHKVLVAWCSTIFLYLTRYSTISLYLTRFQWLVSDSRGSFLMQTIIECCSDEIYTELYSSVCKGHLLSLAVHPQANFVLESLIKGAKDKEQVPLMLQ